jgi:hypothetical protein
MQWVQLAENHMVLYENDTEKEFEHIAFEHQFLLNSLANIILNHCPAIVFA